MKYPAYEKYKPSGVEWLGDAPEHWEVKRLKNFALAQFSGVDKKSFDDEISVELCNYVDVYYNDYITKDLDFMQATATSEEIRRFTLRQNDVIVTKDSESWDDIAVPALVQFDFDKVLCGYHLAHIRPNMNKILGEYLFRAFSASGLLDQFRVAASGVTRYGLPKSSLTDAWFLLPPIQEQKAIVSFLVKKIDKIKKLVSAKQRLIELLKEKRQAIISNAITKGLNPKAKMKDSGIEWLGEIPEHWLVKRLKFLTKINPSASEITGFSDDLDVSFVPMESVGHYGGLVLDQVRPIESVKQGFTYFKDGDITVAKITPCFENGKGCLANDLVNGVAFGTTELHVIRTKESVNNEFLFYLTISRPFRFLGESEMYGAGGQKRVPTDFVKDFKTPLPPFQEQQAIARYLDEQTAKIDKLIDEVKEGIERLKEYRQALISSAVTGKIDVRGVV